MFLWNAPFVTVVLKSADIKHGQAGSTVGLARTGCQGHLERCHLALQFACHGLAYYNLVMAVWQLLSLSSKPNSDPFT